MTHLTAGEFAAWYRTLTPAQRDTALDRLIALFFSQDALSGHTIARLRTAVKTACDTTWDQGWTDYISALRTELPGDEDVDPGRDDDTRTIWHLVTAIHRFIDRSAESDGARRRDLRQRMAQAADEALDRYVERFEDLDRRHATTPDSTSTEN